jgi:circadian clock protein KaiC
MRSIGLDLGRWVKRGQLHFFASRPTASGLEMHLATMHRVVADLEPSAVVLDPITNLMSAGSFSEVNRMLLRLLDFLKSRQITSLFTSLTSEAGAESSEAGVSSLMDTWLLVRNLEANGERNRGLYVLKSRGMAHSNQIREFALTDRGVVLRDVYVGPGGVVTGSARVAQEAGERAARVERQEEIDRRKRAIDRKRLALDAQIEALRASFEADQTEESRLIGDLLATESRRVEDREALAKSRAADPAAGRIKRAGARAGKRPGRNP